jgi:hypothetical protein
LDADGVIDVAVREAPAFGGAEKGDHGVGEPPDLKRQPDRDRVDKWTWGDPGTELRVVGRDTVHVQGKKSPVRSA